MRKEVIHINKLFYLVLLLLISGCEHDVNVAEQQGGGEDTDDKVQIEIFTRANSYDLPSTRAAESTIGMTPWVLVFKGDGGSATFVEAVQAFEMVGKRYVILTKQNSKCQLLILANNQAKFYYNNDNADGYEFNETNLKAKLSGVTLSDACTRLLTEPLSSPSLAIPYSGTSEIIPMSAVLEVSKIDNNTKIQNSDPTKGALMLTRAVARIAVVNTAVNFKLNGIVALFNVARQGQLHNYSNSIMNNASNLTEYQGASDYSSFLVVPNGGQSTDDSPIYIYESEKQNDMYMIIQGKYDSKDYYYKMAIVDTDLDAMDLLRNHSYTFTIINAKGPGYDKVDDAKVAKPSNVDLDFRITVDDSDSYEIMANNDYYLGVSNSVFIAYTDVDKVYEAFNLVTDCEIEFPAARNITDNKHEVDDYSFALAAPADGKLPIVTNGSSSPRITTVEVKVSNWLMFYEEGQFVEGVEKNNAYITLKLGNLEKQVHIRQRRAIGTSRTVLEYRPTDSYPYPGDFPNLMDYHCLTGQVQDGKEWIKLRPSTMVEREDTDRIIVEDGKIFIEILANATGQDRRGTVYLTTVATNGSSVGGSSVKRIKVDITQKGN